VSSPAHVWLAEWRAAAPPSLAAVVEHAVTTADDHTSDTVVILAEAAVACLRSALRIGDDRAAALHLLAADALITAACEVAARTERDLAAIAARFTADRLATLFRDELSSEHS
jgi:hypothetical protein